MSLSYVLVREAVLLDPIDVAEAEDLLFDFTAYAQPGETILSVQLEVDVREGRADAGAANLISGSHAVGRINESNMFVPDPEGLAVLQRFDAAGRTAKNLYGIRCVAPVTGGRIFALACLLPVKRL